MGRRPARTKMTLCRAPFLQNVKNFNKHFQKIQALKTNTLAPQALAIIFLMTSFQWRIAFLQNVQLFNLHLHNSQAPQERSILALQALATIFLMISIKWGIAFLQNVHLFNLHFQNSQAPQKRSILALQVLATIFQMTSFQWGIAFLQKVQLYNNHQTLSHLICQERELRSHFQDMLGLPQRNPRLKPTMSPTSRWKVLRSTRQTSKRGSRRC